MGIFPEATARRSVVTAPRFMLCEEYPLPSTRLSTLFRRSELHVERGSFRGSDLITRYTLRATSPSSTAYWDGVNGLSLVVFVFWPQFTITRSGQHSTSIDLDTEAASVHRDDVAQASHTAAAGLSGREARTVSI
eukprot:PhM_4_TR13978/c0_g1_i1/m.36004